MKWNPKHERRERVVEQDEEHGQSGVRAGGPLGHPRLVLTLPGGVPRACAARPS